MGLFGPKKVAIKSSDLARQYIDEIFSDEQKQLAKNLLDKLRGMDSSFNSVDISSFERELTTIHLVILSAMWIEATLKANIWAKEFMPDFLETMLQDERCKDLKVGFEVYNDAMQQSIRD